jgi:hypothetical protein
MQEEPMPLFSPDADGKFPATAVTYTSTTTIAAATTITDLSSTTVTITTQAPVVATHTQAPIIGGLPSKKKRSLGDDGLVKRDDPHAVIAQALNIATSLVSGFCSCEAPGPTSTATLTVTTPALATTTSTATYVYSLSFESPFAAPPSNNY